MNCQENGQKGYATLAATTAIYVNDALTLLTTINLCDDALTPRTSDTFRFHEPDRCLHQSAVEKPLPLARPSDHPIRPVAAGTREARRDQTPGYTL